MNQLTIDFDKLKDIALRGIRRTYIFLALGVNAARDERLKNYHLTNFSMFRFVPDNVDTQTLRGFKSAFEQWIISNGLRELVESFASFMDGVYRICLVIGTNNGKVSSNNVDTDRKQFEKKGIEAKMKLLRNKFSISTEKEKYFGSINQARNCITHRQGKVGPEDTKGQDTFRFIWLGLDCYAETPKGQRHSLIPPFPKEGVFLEEGANVKVQVIERETEYRIGEVIALSPNDLGEICLLFNLATNDIAKSALEYARKMGVKIRIKKQ